MRKCCLRNCDNPHYGKGYCNRHYIKFVYRPRNLKRIHEYMNKYIKEVYYPKHRERILKKQKEERRKNPEKTKKYHREYYRKTHPKKTKRKPMTKLEKRKYHREYYHKNIKITEITIKR